MTPDCSRRSGTRPSVSGKSITPFVSRDGTLFILGSIFDNIANVGMNYILNQYKVMDKLSIMIEILNFMVDKIDSCYYQLDELPYLLQCDQ